MNVTYTLQHVGKWISWNTLLSLNRWQRTKLLAEAKNDYKQLITKAKVKPLATFSISIRYWSRIDADNCCFKYFIDTLRAMKLVVNDDKRFFKGVECIPDVTLKHNTYIITLTGELA